MQSDQNEGSEKTTGQASSPDPDETTPTAVPAVQGVPWWGGVGHHQALPTFCPNTPGTLQLDNTNSVVPAIRPIGFVHPSNMQQAQGITKNATEDSADGGSDDSQPHSGGSAQSVPTMREYVLPYAQLEPMTLGGYPYIDPYYSGMIAAYGPQAMMYPQVFGINPNRMLLPSEIPEEEPVYVNPKQYKGIMRRRQSRAKAESENRLSLGRPRKPYLHESRHLHAMRRVRGCGGRFLNTKASDDAKSKSDSARSSEGPSSQEGTSTDSQQQQQQPLTMQ